MLDSILENIELSPYASFKVGGKARYFQVPRKSEMLIAALSWARGEGIPVYIFGKGSNLVFSDSGFKGLAIHTGELTGIHWKGNRVTCDAGALMYTLMKQSVRRGLAGIQKLGGIPGTMGGCVYINAGAYGQETSDSVVEVVSCTPEGDLVKRNNKECRFGYRSSLFCELSEVILEVSLEFREMPDTTFLIEEMKESLRHRKETQPLNLPNSGSIFKRPDGMYPGKVIEESGLKGLSRGGAQVSPKHANFIVNTGRATAQQIYDLSMQVKQKVWEDQKIKLEHEVRFVGEFLPWPR